MKEQLIKFLNKINADQQGNLLSVDISEYADKIHTNATLLSINKNREIVALIAFYQNDVAKELAYLTIIGVAIESAGFGYGKLLLEASIKEIKKNGFKKYALEVREDNAKAIKLYSDFGFELIHNKSGIIYMEKIL